MLTRIDPKTNSGAKLGEGIDLETGIRTLTINGAIAMMQEDVTGSIEVGKYADMIILNHNPLEIPETSISETEVQKTIFNGEVVYERDN
jgi:predicted amidohydrolase YtcJ